MIQPEEVMITPGTIKRRDLWDGKRTICAELREMRVIVLQIMAACYDGHSIDSIPSACESLVGRVEDAIDMAKRMDAKLREYKANYHSEVFVQELCRGEDNNAES